MPKIPRIERQIALARRLVASRVAPSAVRTAAARFLAMLHQPSVDPLRVGPSYAVIPPLLIINPQKTLARLCAWIEECDERQETETARMLRTIGKAIAALEEYDHAGSEND